jgi:hypothetical protein
MNSHTVTVGTVVSLASVVSNPPRSQVKSATTIEFRSMATDLVFTSIARK